MVMRKTYRRIWTRDRRHRAVGDEDTEVIPEGFEITDVSVVSKLPYDLAEAKVGDDNSQVELFTDEWVPDRDTRRNERLLLHGTTSEAAARIMKEGFAVTHARSGGVSGRALYFAESSTKADVYAPPGLGGVRAMVFCRGLCGSMHYTRDDEAHRSEDWSAKLRSGECDSVLNDRAGTKNTFREIAILRPELVIPVCVVWYRWTGAVCVRPPQRKG